MREMTYNYNTLNKLPNLYGHVENTKVLFDNEHIFITVLKEGEITFESVDGALLSKITIGPDTKNKMHENVYCKANNGKIKVWLPIIEYIDNYPNCDGEHDRWSSKEIAYDVVEFDVSNNTLSVYKADIIEEN